MGAIDTFDAAGFVALVRRVHDFRESTVYAPSFRRDSGASIAGAIAIDSSAKLVIVEGNDSLVPEKPWDEIAPLLAEVWYCDRDESLRIHSLIVRHMKYGYSESEARRWASGSDQRNAEQIARTRSQADVIVALNLKQIKNVGRKKSVGSNDRPRTGRKAESVIGGCEENLPTGVCGDVANGYESVAEEFANGFRNSGRVRSCVLRGKEWINGRRHLGRDCQF